eukprot:1725083-Pleurochrysis_carterae.AAC.2
MKGAVASRLLVTNARAFANEQTSAETQLLSSISRSRGHATAPNWSKHKRRGQMRGCESMLCDVQRSFSSVLIDVALRRNARPLPPSAVRQFPFRACTSRRLASNSLKVCPICKCLGAPLHTMLRMCMHDRRHKAFRLLDLLVRVVETQTQSRQQYIRDATIAAAKTPNLKTAGIYYKRSIGTPKQGSVQRSVGTAKQGCVQRSVGTAKQGCVKRSVGVLSGA